MNWKCLASLLMLFFVSTNAHADDAAASKDASAAEKPSDELADKFVTTEHSFSVAGETIDYTA
ncbi:MAG: peptidase S10, partial [Rhodopirellula bahusiensis]